MIALRSALSPAERLARAIQEDPRERAKLAELHGLDNAGEEATFTAGEIRKVLDEVPEMKRVPTDLLRSRRRTSSLVRMRLRAIAALYPRFTDAEIAVFLNRCRSDITNLRRKYL